MFTKHVALAAIAAAALLLSSCTSAPAESFDEPATTETETAETATFPRTIEVPAGRSTEAVKLTIEREPTAIAALDYESAEAIASFGLADKLTLVPEAVKNPTLGSHVDEMSEVPNTIPVAMELSVESVLAAEPDLVVMSPRHGAESSIGALLQQAGVQTLILPESWTSPETLAQNLDLIGQATGADEQAKQLVDLLNSGLATGTTGETDGVDAPRVLVLTNQAGRPFATAGNAFPLELLELAGATSVSDELGLTATGPISVEQVVEAAPDAILLIDMNGSGEALFRELLGNPAVSSLDLADRTMLIEGKQVQALGLDHTIDGLAELSSWVEGLRG